MPEVTRICPVDADALWDALCDLESRPGLLPWFRARVTRTRLLTTVVTRRIRPGVHACVLTLEVGWSGPLAPVAGLVLSGLTRRVLRREAAAVERVARQGRSRPTPQAVR